MRLIGLDVGTTGCKVVVFDEEGQICGQASREYPVLTPRSGWAEQDAEAVWNLAQEALREALLASNTDAEIEALGLSVQGEAVIPVNREGQALRPAILGMDARTTAENEWLKEHLGAEYLFERTGMPVHTINTLPKLLWLQRHEPDMWANAWKFLLYEDFFICKMTGQAVISRCLASRTQLYDLLEDRWSPKILETIGLKEKRLAQVWPSGKGIGHMIPDVAKELGLSRPPLVVTGGHDQACAALGAGLVQPELAMVSTGTAEVVEVTLQNPALNGILRQGNMSCYVHVVPDLYLVMTLNHSGGLVLRWFRDTLCPEEQRQAEATGADAYDLILQSATTEPTSLLVLPHLAGSGTPWLDAKSKGAILGLTFDTGKAELVKAILEGLTYELRINLDVLSDGGVEIKELRAVGGGARSPLWLQLKADVTGIRVAVPAVTEAACLGAAMLAGAAVGIYPSLFEAADRLVRIRAIFEPDPKRSLVYQRGYELYRELYPTITPINHSLWNGNRVGQMQTASGHA